jgi:hypothetical protein
MKEDPYSGCKMPEKYFNELIPLERRIVGAGTLTYLDTIEPELRSLQADLKNTQKRIRSIQHPNFWERLSGKHPVEPIWPFMLELYDDVDKQIEEMYQSVGKRKTELQGM